MTQKIVRILFFTYQGIFASRVATCRFQPTCSRYTLEAIAKYGPLKGAYLAALRIANCYPFTKRPIYDPV